MKPPLPSEELGKPERPPATYATAYYRYHENFAKVDKARYEVALRGSIPRGVSSDHVLS